MTIAWRFSMSYMDTIIDGRSPTRLALPLDLGLRELKKWAPMCNVYRSIYGFNRLTAEGAPDWASAVLNTIALDVDVLSTKVGLHDETLIRDVVTWLRQKDYSREYVFTGGGFNVFIGTENATKEKLYEAHYYLRNDLGFALDKAAIDVARGTRFVPSYNFTKRSFVAYITEEEALLPFQTLHKMFQKPRKGRVAPLGTTKWDLKGIKSGYAAHVAVDPGPIEEARADVGIQEIEKKYGKICDTILSIARQKTVSHQERFFLILYIKDVLKVPYEDFTPVYKFMMNGNGDYVHSVRAEQQPRYAYSRGTCFNPMIFKKFGYCPRGCTQCTDMMDDDRELMRCAFI